jgi:hypothetical protein
MTTEQGFSVWLIWGTIFRGWGLTQEGQNTDGIGQLCEGMAAWQDSGSEIFRPYFLALLAETYAKAGKVVHGLKAIIEALACVERTEERFYEAELHRLKGELTLRRRPQRSRSLLSPGHRHCPTDLQKALTLKICKKRRRCWTNWDNRITGFRVNFPAYPSQLSVSKVYADLALLQTICENSVRSAGITSLEKRSIFRRVRSLDISPK